APPSGARSTARDLAHPAPRVALPARSLDADAVSSPTHTRSHPRRIPISPDAIAPQAQGGFHESNVGNGRLAARDRRGGGGRVSLRAAGAGAGGTGGGAERDPCRSGTR